MNGYDFDKTILKGNSVRRFSLFCYVRLPYLWLLLPELLLAVILYGLRIIRKEGFLRMLEFFIVFVPRRQKFVERFWDKNFKHVQQWYLDSKRPDDVVVSASPDFLIDEICSRLNVVSIASKTGKRGQVVGKHCYGAHKVEMFRARFGETKLESFYSDSMTDAPMFQLAQRGYLVKGNKITQVYENGQYLAEA